MCFGKDECLDPSEFSYALLSTKWSSYVYSSPRLVGEQDGSPFARCCKACAKTTDCSNSRNEEHIFLSHIHQFAKNNSAHGIFLEVGGNDGIQASNTLFLERCLQWRGLMIEGHPDNFKRMMINRPGLVGVSSALCEIQGHVLFSSNPSPVSHLEARHITGHITVPCNPLADILHALAIEHIDFFSLDVEGAEVQVLKSISWSKLSIGVMVMEELQGRGHKEDEKNKQARAIVQELGEMEFMFSHCWKNSVCDSYFANPKWVNIDAAKQHLAENPLPHGSQPLVGNECKA